MNDQLALGDPSRQEIIAAGACVPLTLNLDQIVQGSIHLVI